jgi:N-acetylneuraminate synthase
MDSRQGPHALDLASMVDQPSYVYVIAEAGINHNGDLGIAKKLIDMAVDAGCDAVKFQKRTIDLVYDLATLESPRESPWGTTQRAQKEGLEFSHDDYQEIAEYCREVGIAWTASAWDLESLAFVESFDPPFHKVASALATNWDFLSAVADTGRPTLVSTGMCDVEDIDRIVEVFSGSGTRIGLMHTVSTYPTPEDHLNLEFIRTLKERYGLPTGYSGHEPSVSPSIVAAVLGAQFIERHITLDRSMYGSDQAASLEVPGLRQLVSILRKLPGMLGDGVKRWAPGERDVARKLRYWETND